MCAEQGLVHRNWLAVVITIIFISAKSNAHSLPKALHAGLAPPQDDFGNERRLFVTRGYKAC